MRGFQLVCKNEDTITPSNWAAIQKLIFNIILLNFTTLQKIIAIKLITVVSPNSHIFVKPKKRWLFGYVWLFGYYVTFWVSGGFRIKGIDSRITIRFLIIIRKIFSPQIVTFKWGQKGSVKALLRIRNYAFPGRFPA